MKIADKPAENLAAPNTCGGNARFAHPQPQHGLELALASPSAPLGQIPAGRGGYETRKNAWQLTDFRCYARMNKNPRPICCHSSRYRVSTGSRTILLTRREVAHVTADTLLRPLPIKRVHPPLRCTARLKPPLSRPAPRKNVLLRLRTLLSQSSNAREVSDIRSNVAIETRSPSPSDPRCFDDSPRHFRQITDGARERFEKAQWQEAQTASAARINLYEEKVGEVTTRLRATFDAGALLDIKSWPLVKSAYISLIDLRFDDELSETWYNSIFCGLFTTT